MDHEDDQLESTWDRWQRLPLAYRVNACLYVLGFIFLVILLAQVVSGTGGKPRQVEVASRPPSTTRPPRAATTTQTTVPAVSTTAPPASTPLPAAATGTGSSGGSGSAPSPSGSGGGAPSPTAPPDTDPIPGLETLGCQNSTDPRCGPFRWEPPPGNNLPMVINVERSPSEANIGETVTFRVVVTDGDHTVGDKCAVVNFGDGASQNAPCPGFSCPETFGPWAPPTRSAGSATFTFTHAYNAPGIYTANFEFHSDRDQCPDPYGNVGRAWTSVSVS